MMFPPTKMSLKIKEFKCSKCACRVAANQETIDLAINTCSWKKTHQSCGLEQQVAFVRRMEEKEQGIAKPPPKLPLQSKQVPALLKKVWPYPVGDVTTKKAENDWLANPMKCRYCNNNEIDFIAQNGCPCHIFECPLDADLTAAGRNPCPHEEKKTTELQVMGPVAQRRVQMTQIFKNEKCVQCGHQVQVGDMPCDINCHYMSPYEAQQKPKTNVTNNNDGTFDFDVPDVMIITITKKRKMHEEWRSE